MSLSLLPPPSMESFDLVHDVDREAVWVDFSSLENSFEEECLDPQRQQEEHHQQLLPLLENKQNPSRDPTNDNREEAQPKEWFDNLFPCTSPPPPTPQRAVVRLAPPRERPSPRQSAQSPADAPPLPFKQQQQQQRQVPTYPPYLSNDEWIAERERRQRSTRRRVAALRANDRQQQPQPQQQQPSVVTMNGTWEDPPVHYLVHVRTPLSQRLLGPKHARTELLQHWSSSVAKSCLSLAICPFRILRRKKNSSRPNNMETTTTTATEETTTNFTWPFEEVHIHVDHHEDYYYDDDDDDASTAYWSTGTAMESLGPDHDEIL